MQLSEIRIFQVRPELQNVQVVTQKSKSTFAGLPFRNISSNGQIGVLQNKTTLGAVQLFFVFYRIRTLRLSLELHECTGNRPSELKSDLLRY